MIDFKLLINKAKELGFDDIEIVEKSSKNWLFSRIFTIWTY